MVTMPPRRGNDVRALIFDVDGTLADTERDLHRAAFNLAFREAGLDWHWDVPTYGRLLKISGGKERMLYYIRTGVPHPVPANPEALVPMLHAAKTRHYLSLLRGGDVMLRPGVARLLKEAHEAGMVLAIATTTTRDNVTTLLETTLGSDAPRWFSVIGAADDVLCKKPAPDIYAYVLRTLGLPPSACFAFEDSANGLQASSTTGLRTIVTPTGYTADEDFSVAYAVLSDLGEPEHPCRHLSGTRPLRGWIDLMQLRAWQDSGSGQR